jgi:putative transposase
MSEGFKIGEHHLTLSKIGSFRFKAHRELVGKPKHVTVKRYGSKWVARIVCDIGEAPEKRVVSSAVGIDLGLTTFAVLSDGSEIPNPRFVKHHADRIARAQRSVASKKRRSGNRLRAKEQARRAYQRMADARKNFCHHVSKALVARYDLIVHEDLKIANMAKGHFAKSILDAAWGQLLFQLAYKAEEAGCYLVAVNPSGTTQNCSRCGEKVPKDLSQRQHDCPHCGLSLSRDLNAARNVLALSPGRGAAAVLALGSN